MDELEERIAARLHEALGRQAAGGFETYEVAGLATREPAEWPVMRLSIEDAARIAAAETREFASAIRPTGLITG